MNLEEKLLGSPQFTFLISLSCPLSLHCFPVLPRYGGSAKLIGGEEVASSCFFLFSIITHNGLDLHFRCYNGDQN